VSDYTIISSEDAEERFSIADQIWYPYLDFADQQEVRMYTGAQIDGDFTTDTSADWSPFNVIVDGDLVVTGNVGWHDYSGGNFLWVTGDLRASNLVAQGCPNIYVGGDLHVDGGVMGFYGDDGGLLIVEGDVSAQQILNVYYFNMELYGAVDATVVGDSYRTSVPVDFDDGDLQEVLKPDLLDAEGYLDVEETARRILAGDAVLRPGVKPAHIEAIERLERLAEDSASVTEIDLEDSKLRSFPERLLEFENLERLVLSSNDIGELPEEIGRLARLEELLVDRCTLTSLPAEIGELANLRVLDLSSNPLESLPDELGRLSNLRELRLYGLSCPVSNALSGLESLQTLDLRLRHEEPAPVPEAVWSLSSLERLDLRGYALSELSEELLQLDELRELELGRTLCVLDDIPDLSQLPKLRRLGFDGSRRSTTLPYPSETLVDSAFGVSSLERLGLDRWGEQTDYDASVGEHVVVREGLDELPDRFDESPKLRRLDLSFNELESLPDTLFELEHLEFVDLRYNPLSRKTLDRISDELAGVEVDLRNVDTKVDVDDPHWQAVHEGVKSAGADMRGGSYEDALEGFESVLEMCTPGKMYSDYDRHYALYGVVYCLSRLILDAEGQNRDTLVEELIEASRRALDVVPDPSQIWHFTDQGAFNKEIYRYAGNALAWYLYEGEDDPDVLEEALSAAEMAAQFVESSQHWYVLDTKVRILLSLGRQDEAYSIVRRILNQDATFEDFQDLTDDPDYLSWVEANQ
jgi:Leucine-rich repeat (LRR) protein